MRVAWVTTTVPHPAGAGGAAHEFELVRALAATHDVQVLSTHVDAPLPSDAVVAAGAGFTPVPWRRRPYPTSKAGVARGLVRADPNLVVWLGRDRIPRLAAALEAAAAAAPFDVVQVTHGELADLLGLVPGPTGLLLFDALSRAAQTRLEVEPLARRRAQLRVELARTRRFEHRWYPRASGIASVSDVDAAWLTEHLGQPVTVLENPVADAFFEPPARPRRRDLVTFVGALTFAPNVDAIWWLVTEVWPLVRARRPDLGLRVVGRGDGDPAVAETRALVASAGGELVADVEDIRPAYWEATAIVAPLRHGSGLRNKVLHAMACRAPVVATPAALEGVPAPAADAAWQGSTARELAEAIVACVDDPAGAAARAATAAAAMEPLRTPAAAARHERWWASLCR